MPVNPDYVEQLVLEKLAGIITPEDNATLEKLLKEEAQAREIWEELNAQFSDTYLATLRQNLDKELSIDEILASVAKEEARIAQNTRRNIKILVPVGIAAACLVTYFLFKPVRQVPTTLDMAQLANDKITLTLPGQQVFVLGELEKDSTHHIQLDKNTTLVEKNGSLQWEKTQNRQMATLKVPSKMRYHVDFPDGTSVQVNAGTEIKFPLDFTGNSREITLVSGQAFLKVTKQSGHPFILHLAKNDIKVLGTSFDVNAYDPENVQVALTTGKVKVLSSADSVILSPGEKAICNNGKSLTIAPFDKDSLLKWQTREYDFSEAPLRDVVNILSREYGTTISLDSPAVGDQKVMAYMNVGTMSLASIMETLKLASVCDYQFTGAGKDSVLHIYSLKENY